MNAEDLKDEGKSLLDKIPDIAFDWYARIVPGFICGFLIVFAFEIPLEKVSANFLFAALGAYIIGHLLQPFSSGLMQQYWPILRGKKLPLLLKAYAELIGFGSCLFFSIFLFPFALIWNLCNGIRQPFFIYYMPLLLAVAFFVLTVLLRKKAYDRKHHDQNNVVPMTTVNPEPPSTETAMAKKTGA
jgi:hypothetical protein